MGDGQALGGTVAHYEFVHEKPQRSDGKKYFRRAMGFARAVFFASFFVHNAVMGFLNPSINQKHTMGKKDGVDKGVNAGCFSKINGDVGKFSLRYSRPLRSPNRQFLKMVWGPTSGEQQSPYQPKKLLPLLSGGNLVIGKDGWFIDPPDEDEGSKARVADLYGDQAIPIEIEDQMAWLLYRNGLVITTITGAWPPLFGRPLARRPSPAASCPQSTIWIQPTLSSAVRNPTPSPSSLRAPFSWRPCRRSHPPSPASPPAPTRAWAPVSSTGSFLHPAAPWCRRPRRPLLPSPRWSRPAQPRSTSSPWAPIARMRLMCPPPGSLPPRAGEVRNACCRASNRSAARRRKPCR